MSESTIASVIGLVALFINVVVSVVVGAWALRRKTKDDSDVQGETTSRAELARIRREDRERIKKLEEHLDNKDAEIRQLREERAADRVTIREQALKIADLDETVEGLKAELAECLATHQRRTP